MCASLFLVDYLREDLSNDHYWARPGEAGYQKSRQSCRVRIISLYIRHRDVYSSRAGFVIHGYLGGRTLFTKAVGLAFSVASGLSLGEIMGIALVGDA